MTFKLPYLPALIALVLIITGYHFDATELKILGGIYLWWTTLIHYRNIQMLRWNFHEREQIL